MAFFFRESVTVWRDEGLRKNSQSLLDQKHSMKDYRVIKEIAILPFSAWAIPIRVVVGSR
jgi:hypothetical protein